MYTSFFIAKNNMKKKKSDVAVVTLLIILATMLLYISTSVLGNAGDVVENARRACNSSDHVYFTSDSGAEMISDIWQQFDEIKEYEISPILYIPGVKYYSEDNSDKKDYIFVLSALGEERTINKLNIGEHIEEKENSIVLPYSMHISEGYEIGDKFFMEISGETYELEIMGFAEDPLFATALNISMYRCYLSPENIERITEMTSADLTIKYNECRAVFNGDVDVEAYLKKLVEATDGGDKDSIMGFTYEIMSGGIMMMPGISMGITLAFSVILMAIAVIIMRFSIKNFIEENLKNIGILQACGYTSGQLRMATLMEMGLIGVVGCTIGLILSICGDGVVGNIQAIMMGLRYNVGFDIGYGVLAFMAVMAVVLLMTYISSRNYKQINVLDALRGGIHTHNFRKNVMPLHKTRLPLNTAIGTKYIFGAKFKNLGILVIVAILSFASCVGFYLYENFANNQDFMLKLVGSELGKAIVGGDNVDDMGADIEALEEIEKVNYYSCIDANVTSEDKNKIITCDVWKDMDKLENIMLVDGSLPVYDNEIVISTVVRDYLGVKVGDIIYLQNENEKLPYMVSGISQMINNGGQKMLLSYEGAKRLNDSVSTIQLYVYAKDGYDYNDVENAIKSCYPGIQVIESQKMADSALSIVSMAMTMICVLFVTITVVVVFLVVLLLIRTKVVSDRKNNGIYKALGYTTGNLMAQTVMSNLPVIFTGAVVGAITSIFGASPLACMCLSFCGIEKCEMTISPVYLVGTVIGITLVALLVAMAVSAKIRKVEPVKMLTEE